MRIIELLAFLRELLSSELRAIVDALPSALHALREALQATVDNCVALVTGEAVVPRPRRVRHRHRRIGKRKRLSRMNASGNLTCAIQADSAMAATEPVNALVIEEAQAVSPRVSARARSPLSLADLAYAHDLVERASRVEELENDEERGARSQVLATDIEHFLEAVTGNIQELEPKSEPDDDAVAALDDGNASVDLDNQEGTSPPLSSSDWGDAAPGVAGVASTLPPGWNTDWKTNSYAMLHSTSSSSDASSVGEEVDDSTDQVEKPNEEQAEPVKESPEASDLSAEVPSSPVSTTSSISSCYSIAMLSNGLSYRQLAQELAPPDRDDEETSAFYRVALQKLKEERKLRARLRAESMASDDSEDGASPPTSAPALNGLRSMRVTPLQPEYDNDDDDAARSERKKKLESLRTRTTPFMIKNGQPLSVKSLLNAPAHDGPHFA